MKKDITQVKTLYLFSSTVEVLTSPAVVGWQCGDGRDGGGTYTLWSGHHQGRHRPRLCVHDSYEDRCRLPTTQRRSRVRRCCSRPSGSYHISMYSRPTSLFVLNHLCKQDFNLDIVQFCCFN